LKVVLNEKDNSYRLDKKINDLSEYTEAIRVAESKIDDDSSDYVWFRGMSSQSFKLIPSQCREKNWKHDALLENDLISEFIHKGRALIKGNSNKNSTWDWLHVCQHYGIPTRLLDWSESALVALYFAIEDPKATSPCVWVFNPMQFNKASTEQEFIFFSDQLTRDEDDNNYLEKYKFGSKELPKNPIAFFPPHVDERIRAQKGCFTIHGSNKHAIHELNRKTENPFLVRIEISKSAVEHIRWQLNVLGINTSDIFPDLSGLAKELRWKYQL
jgi:hypothetical protein